eukprot:3420649-Pyramimonas_sp.AAC.1
MRAMQESLRCRVVQLIVEPESMGLSVAFRRRRQGPPTATVDNHLRTCDWLARVRSESQQRRWNMSRGGLTYLKHGPESVLSWEVMTPSDGPQ